MPTILVVDDDAEFARFLERYLSRLGLSVFTVATGDEGLELSRTVAVDLVLLDWCLKKGVPAEEALKLFQSHPPTKGVPVAVMSGIKEGPEDEALARRCGAAQFFTKAELSDTVRDSQVFLRRIMALVMTREGGGTKVVQPGLKSLVRQTPMPDRILVIDDDPAVRDILATFLREKGYSVACADSGALGIQKALQSSPDLIILDLGLPDIDGLDVCAQLKANPRTRRIPVLVLTGRSSKKTPYLTLEYSADHCLAKPIPDWDDFFGWVAALLRRRAHSGKHDSRIRVGNALTIDLASHVVILPDRTITDLAPSLFRLLCAFARHPEETLSREHLMLEALGHPVEPHHINLVVMRLKKCLGKDFEKWFVCVRGYGFRFTPVASN
jgi:DNA-binding response OmpR family regulator